MRRHVRTSVAAHATDNALQWWPVRGAFLCSCLNSAALLVPLLLLPLLTQPQTQQLPLMLHARCLPSWSASGGRQLVTRCVLPLLSDDLRLAAEAGAHLWIEPQPTLEGGGPCRPRGPRDHHLDLHPGIHGALHRVQH